MKLNSAVIFREPLFSLLVEIVPGTIIENEKHRSSLIFSDYSLQKAEESFTVEYFRKLERKLRFIETYGAVDVGCLSLAVGINPWLMSNS
jgi:hypothetical protein